MTAKNLDKAKLKEVLKGVEPDEWDRKNIINIMNAYEKKYPYPNPNSIGRCLQVAAYETSRGEGTTARNNMKRMLSLPEPFVRELKQAYPFIFTDNVQFDWFIRNFPNLLLTDVWVDDHSWNIKDIE